MTIGTSLSTNTLLNLTTGIQTVTDSVSPTNLTDVYRFTLAARSSFSVSVLGMTGNADLRLVRDGNSNAIVDATETLASSLNPGVQADAIQLLNLEAGTYHVLVSLAGSSGSATYTLRMGAQTTTQTDVLWRDPIAGTVGYWQFSGLDYVGTRPIALPANVYGDWRVEGIGDLNGDRVDDIFWRNVNTRETGVWLMSPQGTETASVSAFQVLPYQVPLEYRFAGLGDLDGDGKADAIWRHNSLAEVNYWLMDGTEVKSHGVLTQGLDSSWLLEGVADFDGNQRVDLLWRNRNTGQLQTWLLNGATVQGGGVLQTAVPLEWEISGLGDLSGDGKADVLWRNRVSGAISIWLLSGSQYTDFAAVSYNDRPTVMNLDWQCVGVDDFNGDGKADVLWRNTRDGTVNLWQMNGLQLSKAIVLTNPELVSLTRQTVGTAVRPVGVDLQTVVQPTTQADVLWRDPVAGTVGYWQFSGTNFVGSRTVPLPRGLSGDWRVEGIGDLNGDRVDDLFWRNVNTKETGVSIVSPQAPQDLSGTTFQLLPYQVPLEYRFAGLGDLDGDGKADVIWRHSSVPQISYWLMDGAALKTFGVFAQGLDSNWLLEGVADFDGNQRVDLLWRNRTTGQLQTWLMNGTTIQGGSALQTPVPLDWEVLGLGDLSGDGKADILWRNRPTGEIGAWLLSGSQYTSFAFLTYNNQATLMGLDWQCVGVDDFSGDGKADVLWRNTRNGTVNLWQMNGLQLSQVRVLTNPELTNLTRQAIGTAVRPLSDTAPPTIQLALAQDTGTPNDRITAIPTITARILDQSALAEVSASLNGQPFFNILSWVGSDGSVTLDRTRLEAIFGRALNDQAHQLTVQARDQFGNLTTTATTWTLDTTAPTGLSVTLAGASDTGRSATDRITRSTAPLITGTVEASSRVQLLLNGTLTGQAIATSGTWQLPLTALVDGTYQVGAIATDLAGNTSQVALMPALVVDTIAPTAPINLRRLATSIEDAPNAVTVSGTAESGAIVTLYQETQVLGEGLAASDGSWTITTRQLGSGTHVLTTTATDAAGNVSGRSGGITVDPLPAPAPQGVRLAPESDTGLSNSDGITNSTTLVVVGTAESGAIVKLLSDDRTLLGQSQADATGNWRIGITQFLADKTYNLTATARNAIGQSAASEPFKLTIDRAAPIVTLTTPLGNTITPNTRLTGTVNGTGSAGTSLNYRLGTGTPTAIQPAANGLFNSVLTLGNGVSGTQSLTLTATDLAGNQSTPLSYSALVNSSSVTPDAPMLVADLTQDTGVSRNDRFTNQAGMTGIVSSRNRIVTLEAALVVPSVLVAGGIVDPVATAPFQAITANLDSAGNFSLTQEQLIALYGNELSDGTYALKLRAKDEQGNFSQEMRVTFTLDRTAPTQDITSLIDGITWTDDEVLAGSVSDGTGTGVNQVAYRVWQAGSPGGNSGDKTVTIAQSGTFRQALTEIKDLAPGVYDFSVTSVDVAGNQQSQAFRFLKPDNAPIEDQEPYILGYGELVESDGSSFQSPGSPGAPLGSGGSWGYVGGGGGGGGYSWGSYGSRGWTPSGFSGVSGTSDRLPYNGSGYDLEYTDSIETIANYGAGAISKDPRTISKKAALTNRKDVLWAVADRLNQVSRLDQNPLNDSAFFARMQGVMQNIFVKAYNPTDKGTYSPLNGLNDQMSREAGYILAQDVVSSSTAVSVQVFQAMLLAAFNEVLYGRAISFTPEVQQTLLKAALELGQTYAKLAPSPGTNGITGNMDYGFLDLLWRTQQPGANGLFAPKWMISLKIDTAVKGLKRLLDDVSDPVATVKFLNNLLNAAASSVSLNEVRIASTAGVLDYRGDIRSGNFIHELVKFGFEVAKVNPTVTTGEAVVSEFLSTLWRGGDEKKAQGGLNQFFEGVKSGSDRVKLLEFGDRLLDAAQLVQDPELQTQKKDARFLSQLLNLGSSYAALNPIAGAEDQSLNFFLDTTYRLDNVQLAAQQLGSFLQAVTNPDVVLFANADRLKSLNKITDSDLQNVKRNNAFIQKNLSVTLTEKPISLLNIKDYQGIKTQTNPSSLISISKFIDIVEKIEKAYPNDTTQEIITRIRRLYYPGDSGLDFFKGWKNEAAFDALLPNAPNREPNPFSLYSNTVERKVYKAALDKIDKNAYTLLTAKADENGKQDNSSPYLVIPERNEMIDIGHVLLTLDALLHPGSDKPFSDPYYKDIPTIDPASWVADVGIGSAWLTLQQLGRPHGDAPKNLKLFSTPTKEQIDAFYKASAPEADILGDVDGFGLFDRFSSFTRKDQPLSKHLKEYYLGEDGYSIQSRWRTFADRFQVNPPIDGTFVADKLTELVKQAWVARINRFNNLYGDGSNAVTGFDRKLWTWDYTGAMFERFVEYVQEQLKNERKS